MVQRDAYFGLLKRHECVRPTWRGWLLLMLACSAVAIVAALKVQPFLALTQPVPAEVLVVEGWVPDYVLEETAGEFARGHYRKLYVTGGPIEKGLVLSEYKTYAETGAAILLKTGMSSNLIEAVPAQLVQRDRTFAAALALKHKLLQQPDITGLNLVSVGAHARRSRLLFQKAFDNDLRVGIIAIKDRNYQGERWWRSSEGVRAVVDESVAYLYAILVFPFLEP